MTGGTSNHNRWFARSVRALLVMVGSSPLWVPFIQDVPGARFVARAFEAWFAFQCERDTGRSLFLRGLPMPVCTRCFGIYLGLLLGALVLRPRLGAPLARLWVAIAALLMLLDVLTEALRMRPQWAPLRIVTGLLLSYPVSISLVQAAHFARPEKACSASKEKL
jgi:uncharacterized membrane protein